MVVESFREVVVAVAELTVQLSGCVFPAAHVHVAALSRLRTVTAVSKYSKPYHGEATTSKLHLAPVLAAVHGG